MRPLLLLAAAAVLLSPAAPAAAERPEVPPPPMVLPGDATASAASAAPADRRTWLVGARRTAAAARIARQAGAEPVIPGTWLVATERARALAGGLRARGLLTYAQPNRLSTVRQAVPHDPYDERTDWIDAARDPALVPPPVTPESPLIALIDSRADVTHPEFAAGSGGNLAVLDGASVGVSHGTATAAVAIAPANGVGITGVWPGARGVNVPLPNDGIRCSDSARGVRRAVAAGAAVINMSYGSTGFCQAEYVALQRATNAGVTLVAAAGNEFDQGNPLEFPASLPHVLTVAAYTPDETAAYFSNENAAMDLAAPGVGIWSAVPVRLDTEDNARDGYEALAGTSFSAPMVAAAAAWVRQARPDLTVDQVQQVVRLSARDIGEEGYDSATGFGALDIGAALGRRPPVADRQEPNEDIRFVDGREFGRAATYVSTGRERTFRALLDVFEDPADVYRLRVPSGRRVEVSIKPSFGNPDVLLLPGSAQSLRNGSVLDRSRRNGQRRDAVSWRNRTGRRRNVYVAVGIPQRERTLDAGYTLTAR